MTIFVSQQPLKMQNAKLVQSENFPQGWGDQKIDVISAAQFCCEIEVLGVRLLTPDFRQT